MTTAYENSFQTRYQAIVSFWNKAFFVYLVLYAGGSIAFFRTIAGTVSLFLAAILLAIINHLKFSKNLLISIGIWFLYFICSSFAIGSIHPFFMAEIPVALLCAYVTIHTLGHKCISLFVQTVYCLAAVSIPLFLLQVFLPQVILPVLHSLNLQGDILTPYADCGSILLYSYNILIDDPQVRNCGFCWEPGAFACFCIFALALNYYFDANKSKNVILVLLIGLLTTFSTTGYCIFFLLVCTSFLRNKKFIMIPVILLLLYVMTNIDFLWDKINDQLHNTLDFEVYIKNSISYDKHYALGRFSSFLLAWRNFIIRPIFGYAGNTTLEYSVQLGADVAIISGWGLLIARYGLCGLLMFLHLLRRSASYWDKFVIKTKGSVIVPWLILHIGITVSYKLFLTPVFFVFYFFPFFSQSKDDSSNMEISESGDL